MYGHYFWLSYSCLLLLNVFGTLSYLIVSKTLEESGALFGVSIVVFLILTPAGCFCWNRPLYKALRCIDLGVVLNSSTVALMTVVVTAVLRFYVCRKNSSMQFCLFFPFFGVQILIIFVQLLGIDYLGAW